MSTGQFESAWQDLLVDHSQFPRHHGSLDHSSHRAEGENPLCGDRVRLELDIDEGGHINAARFTATGCAISVASASIMTDAIQGLGKAQALELFGQVHHMLTTGHHDSATGQADLDALRLVNRFPLRVKCATLCWHTLRQAIEGRRGLVTTETP